MDPMLGWGLGMFITVKTNTPVQFVETLRTHSAAKAKLEGRQQTPISKVHENQLLPYYY